MPSGDTAHQRRSDPAHHVQRVPADGSRQGGDARPRPRTPQGDDPLDQYLGRMGLTRSFQDGYFDGYDPYTNPSAASGFTSAAFRWKKNLFSFFSRMWGRVGAAGVDISIVWRVKALLFMPEKYFYGWEILHAVIVKMGRGLKSTKHILCQKILWTKPLLAPSLYFLLRRRTEV